MLRTRNLVANLRSKGETCHLVYAGDEFAYKDSNEWRVNPLHAVHFKQLLASIQGEAQPPLRGIVHLWSLNDSIHDQTNIDDLDVMQARSYTSVLNIVHMLAAQKGVMPKLWLVTHGVQAVGEKPSLNIASSPLWGLGRVIATEQPSLNCVCVDLGIQPEDDLSLFDEIWSPDAEDQVALRGAKRYIARLVHHRAKRGATREKQPVELVTKERGVLDNLTLRPMKPRQPDQERSSDRGSRYRSKFPRCAERPGHVSR